MWVWAQNEATPAANGNAHRSPQVIAQARKIRRPNGNTGMYGFHTECRKSGPAARTMSPHPTSVNSISGVPCRRFATSAMPAIEPPLIARAPSDSPIEAPATSR